MTRQPAVQTQTIAKPTLTLTTGGILQRAAINPLPVHDVPPIVHEVLRSSGQPLDATVRGRVASRRGWDFSGIRVTPAQPKITQARLIVGQPGDRFEQEADSVADRIMRFPETGNNRSRPPTVSSEGESLRRAADAPVESESEIEADHTERSGRLEGQEEEAEGSPEEVAAFLMETDDLEGGIGTQTSEEPSTALKPFPMGQPDDRTIQRQELLGRTPTVSPSIAKRIGELSGRGQPLSASARAFYEPRFGHDFGQVRVHVGTEASRLAHSVQAKAFTVGRDVVFGHGYFQPGTSAGQRLMAHELTHVLQQQEGLSRSPSNGIQVQHTMQPQLQGGFFGKVWSGIKKGASAAWGGIKKGAGAAWSGTKWAAGKVWGGIKAVSRWGWNVLKSGAALVWNLVTKFPGRVWRLVKHLGSGIAGVASWLWEGLKLAWHLNFKGLGKWFVDGILSGAAWVGRLVGKLVDIAGLGEVWDLLFQIIKFNTRPLTSVEKSEAQKTFKSSISYWQVRIDEYSLISAIGALFSGGGGMGVTTFHTVNFNQKIHASPGSQDMHWLTHELTHVSQYEHAGSQYLGEAIHAQATAGYDYKGQTRPLWRPATNPSPNPTGKHFREFNREQQADIAADYYYSLFGKPVPSGSFTPITSDYEPDVDELRKGDL